MVNEDKITSSDIEAQSRSIIDAKISASEKAIENFQKREPIAVKTKANSNGKTNGKAQRYPKSYEASQMSEEKRDVQAKREMRTSGRQSFALRQKKFRERFKQNKNYQRTGRNILRNLNSARYTPKPPRTQPQPQRFAPVQNIQAKTESERLLLQRLNELRDASRRTQINQSSPERKQNLREQIRQQKAINQKQHSIMNAPNMFKNSMNFLETAGSILTAPNVFSEGENIMRTNRPNVLQTSATGNSLNFFGGGRPSIKTSNPPPRNIQHRKINRSRKR